MRKDKISTLFLLIAGLLLANLACSLFTSERLMQAVGESTRAAGPGDTPGQATAEESIPATEAADGRLAPQPTGTPLAEAPRPPAEALALLDEQGYYQGETILLTAAFLVANPNANYAIEDSQYQVVAYDEAGTVLESGFGYLDVILPGQRMGVVENLYLGEGQRAARVEVLLESGEAVWLAEPVSVFSVDRVAYFPDEIFPKASALVFNALAHNITEAGLAAIAYDETGAVIGGGHTYINFIPGGGQTGVTVALEVPAPPARIELFPSLSGLSELQGRPEQPRQLNVSASGFGQSGTVVGVGFVIENSDRENSFESSAYRAIVYDQEGGVLDAGEGYIEVALPGERLGFCAELYLPDGAAAARAEVQLLEGDRVRSDLPSAVFSVAQTKYIPDQFFPKASGVVSSSLEVDVTNLRVNALVYYDDGSIGGCGYTYLDFLPAGAQSGVDVGLAISSPPESAELFPTLSALSDLQEAGAEHTALALVGQGFGQDGEAVGIGFLVRNDDPLNAIEDTEYQVAVYDAGGTVLDSSSGYLPLLYPGETMAAYEGLYLPEGAVAERIEVQLHGGDVALAPLVAENPFSTQNVQYLADAYFPKATGIVVNELDVQITEVRVVALAFDAEDRIIGGGYTYLDFVPAGGQAAAQVYLTVGEAPARVELYPNLSGLSEVGE